MTDTKPGAPERVATPPEEIYINPSMVFDGDQYNGTVKYVRADLVRPAEVGHVLLTPETCPCDKTVDYPTCNVCDGGLAVCARCGKGEVELSGPCAPAEVDVRAVVETWAAELADPIPYDADLTGPIPKSIVVPNFDVETLINRLAIHVGQSSTTERARQAAEEIVEQVAGVPIDCPAILEEFRERASIESLVKAITTHLSASRGDGDSEPTLTDLAQFLGWGKLDAQQVFDFAVSREKLLRLVQAHLETRKSSAPNAEAALLERLAVIAGAGEQMRGWQPIETVKAMRDKWERLARGIDSVRTPQEVRSWASLMDKVNAANSIITALEEMGGERK